jgi:hypothetical protein
MIWLTVGNICFANDHGYVPLLVSTSRSFLHSCLITEFVTRVTRRMPLMEQKPLNVSEHLSSSPVFSGVRVARSLVLCVVFCRPLFLLLVFFLLAIVCPSSIYRFALNLWYLQTFFNTFDFSKIDIERA